MPAKKAAAKKKKIKTETAKTSVEAPPAQEEIQKAVETSLKREDKKSDFVSSGIPKLDANLGGGYPLPATILVEGPPGAGKTPLSIAFIDAGLRAGNKSIFVCMNNFPNEIKKIAKNIGYSAEGAEFIDSYSWLVGKKSEYEDAPALDPTRVLEIMEDVLKQGPAENIVVDSISTMFLYHDERTVQKFVQAFVAMVKEYDACALIVLESKTATEEMRSTLEYLTDGTIIMDKDVLTIGKMMGVEVKKREMRFTVTKRGFEIKD